MPENLITKKTAKLMGLVKADFPPSALYEPAANVIKVIKQVRKESERNPEFTIEDCFPILEACSKLADVAQNVNTSHSGGGVDSLLRTYKDLRQTFAYYMDRVKKHPEDSDTLINSFLKMSESRANRFKDNITMDVQNASGRPQFGRRSKSASIKLGPRDLISMFADLSRPVNDAFEDILAGAEPKKTLLPLIKEINGVRDATQNLSGSDNWGISDSREILSDIDNIDRAINLFIKDYEEIVTSARSDMWIKHTRNSILDTINVAIRDLKNQFKRKM